MSRFKSLLLRAGLLGSLLGFAHGTAFANPEAGTSAALRGSAEQRIALVIGNSNYQNAPQLANPDNDAQSMAQFLNSAGFEVIAATDLTQNDMISVVQDFSAKVSARGPNTVAMVYYAGHGVQLAGENYLVPVDAKISTPTDLASNSVRLVDVMGTLETIPSRMRIVVLDACRNNPFPDVNDAGRGLAIVDAPNGSIVGYSTAPGIGSAGRRRRPQPVYAGLPARRARAEFADRAVVQARSSRSEQRDRRHADPVGKLVADLRLLSSSATRRWRQPARLIAARSSRWRRTCPRVPYVRPMTTCCRRARRSTIRSSSSCIPHDPLCDRIRGLLGNLVQAQAWHKTVLANSPVAYKSFYDNYGNSPYAQSALKLQSQPKNVPLMQFTHLMSRSRLARCSSRPMSACRRTFRHQAG